MSSSCLSAATIVRCAALSKLQNGIVFVPPAVQMIFLALLTALYWRSGRRKYFMLLADGSAFYIIALLDLLSHVIPVARNSLNTFKVFDIVIGALSFVPIFLYITFLFLYSRSYFIPVCTGVRRSIMKYAFLVVIPVTIAMNELGSFLGIGYRVFQNSQGQSFLAIGFTTGKEQDLWQFVTTVSLVLLLIIQGAVFLFSCYVAVSLIRRHRVDRDSPDVPTLRGVVWVGIGVNIGVVETLLGFVSGGFSIIFTRRLLRMVSRCCLAYGALQSDGATISQGTGRRRSPTMSQVRAMISNPRMSTFVRLSPTAEEFYSMPRAADGRPRDADGPIPRPNRVTVHYDGRSAPELNLRLSVLDVPPAEVLTATFDKRGTIIADGEWHSDRDSRKSSSRSLTRSLSAIAPPSAPMADYPAMPRGLRSLVSTRSYTTSAMDTLSSVRSDLKYASMEQRESSGTNYDALFPGGHRRFMSGSSSASDSLSIVNNLAAQFPGIPPRRTASGRRFSYSEYRNIRSRALDGVEEAAERNTVKSTVSPSNSIKRKPPPSVPQEHEARLRREKTPNNGRKLSKSNSARRKGAVPPPIDSSIAGPDASLSQKVSISPENTAPVTTPYTGRSAPTARPQTPGMTYRSGNSTTDHETDLRTMRDMDGAIDPFADSDVDDAQSDPRYRISALATAESGLNRIASHVAQYDRQQRQAYRHTPQPSPVKHGVFDSAPSSPREGKGKMKASEEDCDTVEFPSVNETLGVPISRPRKLSAISSNSNSSVQSAVHMSGRKVAVAARYGPNLSNATLVPSTAFKHAHTTSTTSAMTSTSHTDHELMRIKSIGRVATRRTPTVTPSTGSFAARSSMRIDSVDISSGELTDQSSASPTMYRFQRRPQHESSGSNSVAGVRTALRQAWTATSDEESEFPDRRRSRSVPGLH